ncbi:hypothetical protein SLEP1_g17563, partial [Rubroshorea leprosula]
MAPMRKKNCSGRSQLRHRRVRFPMSSSFCFRQGLFLPRLLPFPVSETRASLMKKNRSRKSQLRRFQSALALRNDLQSPEVELGVDQCNCTKPEVLLQSALALRNDLQSPEVELGVDTPMLKSAIIGAT